MILVTGATGFLGAELVCQLLQKEDLVRCIKREQSVIPDILLPLANKIEWVNVDILDFSDLDDAFENIDQVYHCAALVSFNSEDSTRMMDINVKGTANVVDLCIHYQVKKLIHVSSVAALGKAKANEIVTENNYWDAYDKNNNYAISKYRGEMEVWRGINEGLKAVIVNPSVIIGEHVGHKGSGAIFKVVQKGLKFYPPGGTGFVDVKDVANKMIQLMDTEIVNERFIINAENYAYKDLFNQIALRFGVEAPQKVGKKWMFSLAWCLQIFKRLFTKKSGGITRDIAKTAFKTIRYSNDKIVKTLNTTFIPLEISIANTVNSMKRL
jgi:dihydroflavonol-4-reductase